jgi:hypothetical protein
LRRVVVVFDTVDRLRAAADRVVRRDVLFRALLVLRVAVFFRELLARVVRFRDDERCGLCPSSPCCFITVRAATSFARFPYRPSSFALSRMCSYWRCSFSDAPRRCFFPGMSSSSLLLETPCRAYAAGIAPM